MRQDVLPDILLLGPVMGLEYQTVRFSAVLAQTASDLGTSFKPPLGNELSNLALTKYCALMFFRGLIYICSHLWIIEKVCHFLIPVKNGQFLFRMLSVNVFKDGMICCDKWNPTMVNFLYVSQKGFHIFRGYLINCKVHCV